MTDQLEEDDGYPTFEDLERIAKWERDWRGLMAFIRPLWNYADIGYWEEKVGADILDRPCTKFHISTGGWSGNESIIGALMENTIFWMMCWEQSRRGGHYIFELKP